MKVAVPGYGTLEIRHLVLDYNGTLAVDGELEPGIGSSFQALAPEMTIHVVTADTFGKAARRLEGLPCQLSVLGQGEQDQAKLDYVKHLGPAFTAAVGNGRNDRLMLEQAALGIAVILREGAAVRTVMAADIVCTDIGSALQLLYHPLRLTATLRS